MDIEMWRVQADRQLQTLMNYLQLKTSGADPTFHPLTARLTSTSFDGDSFSTTALTVIDLSAEFGAPPNIKAVLVRVMCRDSASLATQNLFVSLSPMTAPGSLVARPSGIPDDWNCEANGIVPCDANGDIGYQIGASGAGTMDVWIYINGYWL